jgi:hypothetical protein
MNLVKGAPRKSIEQMAPGWIRWSHCLDEVQYRGTDLRKLGHEAKRVAEKMDELYELYRS